MKHRLVCTLQLRSWLVAIGYSLCLGTINTKMWRVYYIFRYPKLKSSKTVIRKLPIHTALAQPSVFLPYMQPVKDWHLLLFVVLFLLIDVILLSFTTSFTTSRLQAVSVADAEHKEGGINVNLVVRHSIYRSSNLIIKKIHYVYRMRELKFSTQLHSVMPHQSYTGLQSFLDTKLLYT